MSSVVNPSVTNNRIYENILLFGSNHERDVRLGSKGRGKGGCPRMIQKSASIEWGDDIPTERTRWLYLQKMDQSSMVMALWTLCQKSISIFLSVNQYLTDQPLFVYFPKTSW